MRQAVEGWVGSALGGGGRDLGETWTRLEADPIIEADPFSGGHWTPSRGIPLFAWPLLVAAVCAISSAGTAFEEMAEVPPLTLAAWRLQLTSVLLLIGAAYQWRTAMNPEDKERTLHSWQLLLASGTCLAIHFGAWVWGLEHTTLTHSLVFVCSTPILVAFGMWALRKPISRGELAGTLAGFGGGVLLAVGPRSSREKNEVHFSGDAASLAAAAALVGYLAVGRTLRQWMPIFVYAFPVTALAALELTLVALVAEHKAAAESGAGSVVGWLTRGHYAGWVVYLSVGPGIVGHTGFNTLLRYLTPLTVSLAFQLEPLVGSLIGWAAGVVDAPGWATYVGGAIVLAATCVVTYFSTQRELREEKRGVAALELENVFTSEAGESLQLPVSGQPQASDSLDHQASTDECDPGAVNQGTGENEALLGKHNVHMRHHSSTGANGFQ